MATARKFNRLTDHLGAHAGAYADACLQAVEDLFDAAWLRKNKGHRLQTLWARLDPLATNELYALGKAILNLKTKHGKWLESTAKRVKNNPADSHGLTTEILVCGSFAGKGGAEVSPAKNNEPGIDLVVKFPSSFKYMVSIKNHDISKHEKAFQTLARKVKDAFVTKLKKLGQNGKLMVSCEDYMTDQDFKACLAFVQDTLQEPGMYELSDGRVKVAYANLVKEQDREFAKSEPSSAVMIYCRHHRNEQLNFKSKLTDAAENMQRHVSPSPDHFRLLQMRVHASADILALESAAQEMLDAPSDCGLDGVWLTQSTGVREAETNKTTIYTVLRAAMRGKHAGQIKAAQQGEIVSYEFGIGSMGTTPVTSTFSRGDGTSLPMPSDFYLYQKTDFYYLMQRTASGLQGNLQSPASGVHYHQVAEIGGREIVIKAHSPEAEDVLIV